MDGPDLRPPLPELRPAVHHPANRLGQVGPDHDEQGERFCLLRIGDDAGHVMYFACALVDLNLERQLPTDWPDFLLMSDHHTVTRQLDSTSSQIVYIVQATHPEDGSL